MNCTRRHFLGDLGALSVCLPFSMDLLAALLGKTAKQPSRTVSRVVVIRDARVLVDGRPAAEVVSSMLRAALERLLSSDIGEALRQLFSGAKRVGIKVNCLGGKPLATRREVAYGLANLIIDEVGDDCSVTIWDRSESELRNSGFEITRKGKIQCLATDSKGIGYESFLRESGVVGSKFSKLLTKLCDCVVSLGVLKDHGIAGVSGCMKNFFGAIHNPNKYHPNGCDPYVADLFDSDVISRKHRLSIVDGLVGIYAGGPGYKPKYRWEFKGLILGLDAVAVDRVCLDLIEKRRNEVGLPSLVHEQRNPEYIFTAGRKEIGCSDLGRIKVIEMNRGL